MKAGSRVTDHESRISGADVWTVVPVRGFAEGKSRLASVLDPAERARLNARLLVHTLGVLDRWRGGLSRCIVVSPCRGALGTAARLGAAVVDEGADSTGLNAAVALGASYAGSNGGRCMLVLPCDLPCLSTEALAAMLDAAKSERHMVIAPDSRGTGTNALLVSVEPPLEFRFGELSFARHLLLAAERGWRVSVCPRPELEFDLDTPDDLAAWRGSAGSRTSSRR